jgi:hypothetical protein
MLNTLLPFDVDKRIAFPMNMAYKLDFAVARMCGMVKT